MTKPQHKINANFLRVGDKVKIIDGEILTVKSLEFNEFTAKERNEYIPKRDIHSVVERAAS